MTFSPLNRWRARERGQVLSSTCWDDKEGYAPSWPEEASYMGLLRPFTVSVH
ncbi:hypothetical protein Bpfe_012048, partial [Biomphalaria pfeifferi]